jgi:hypothetical protein
MQLLAHPPYTNGQTLPQTFPVSNPGLEEAEPGEIQSHHKVLEDA